jgi:hypothetical protein
VLKELSLGQTIAAGAFNAAFSALFIGLVAALLVKRYEIRAAERRRAADMAHEEQLQHRGLEHQTRAALRDTYAGILVAQRVSRQASLELAYSCAGGTPGEAPAKAAELAHATFIDHYHRLNLDATPEMWRDARALRNVLDDMLAAGREGDIELCQALLKTARSARQNLEGSFRERLGYTRLQSRRDLGQYDRQS